MASNQPLAPLFEADRLAIIGASDRNHYAVNVFKNLQNFGFDISKVVPINPGRAEVFGLKAYPSILDVPGELPLAVIAVNTQNVLAVRSGKSVTTKIVDVLSVAMIFCR